MEEHDVMDEVIPQPGHWPVEPQEDLVIDQSRIWIDGCFDFSHHGHAGAMLQARRLGRELVVGIHSDEAILHHKGPTVMTLKERVAAVDACRWSSKSIPDAPYVTSLPWISHYGCRFVVHGDDITSDSGGEDCYRFVKAAGRFLVVRRTPGISTTDLVGRMLLCTKSHFIRSILDVLNGREGEGEVGRRRSAGQEMRQRIEDYASDETGLSPGCPVYCWTSEKGEAANGSDSSNFIPLVKGKEPQSKQRIVYVDGGFDLFSPGHIEFLRQVTIMEGQLARESGWISDDGPLDSPAYIIAGVHDDTVINRCKGLNYPIMNIFERGLCALQCRYIHSLVFSAPFAPTHDFLSTLPFGKAHAVYHGPTSFMPLASDPYADARALGLFRQVDKHEFQHINAEEIVQRILKSRQMYEARQIAKGEKAFLEKTLST